MLCVRDCLASCLLHAEGPLIFAGERVGGGGSGPAAERLPRGEGYPPREALPGGWRSVLPGMPVLSEQRRRYHQILGSSLKTQWLSRGGRIDPLTT